MRLSRFVLPAVSILLFLFPFQSTAQTWLISAGQTLTVGVLKTDASKLSDRYNDSFSQIVRANLELSGVYQPLPEATIQSALDARGLSLPRSGFANPAVGGEVGRIVGVEYMVVSTVTQQGNSYGITLVLVKTANDSVLYTVSVDGIGQLAIDFEPAIANAVAKLVGLTVEPVVPEQFTEGPLKEMLFAKLEGGRFTMGSERGEGSERPVRQVRIEPFELMTTEVTQSMWNSVMGENPSKYKGPNLPVEKVTLDEIKKFIVAMNIKDPDHFYRLPTESEWEYAARGGVETQFPFADDAVGLDFFAWFKENSKGKTHEVGTREPNPFGLYDMLGNVFEYCVDSWYDDYTDAPVSSAARFNRRDKNGPRVIRGGSFTSSAWNCRPASRLDHHPNRREEYVGFRLARNEK